MGIVSSIIGIVAIILALISLLPLLWWINWIVIPLAVVGFAFGAIGLGIGVMKGIATTGILLNIAAAVIGFWRL